jgi:hypothetical protein
MKLIGIVVAIIVSVLQPRASVAGDKIVLESFTDGKTDEATRVLSPLLDALANRGFVGGDTIRRRFEERVSKPSLTGTLPADLAAQIETAHLAWSEGRFDDAIAILTKLVDFAHANTGAFAHKPDARDLLAKALIVLALSHQKKGDPKAMKQTFGELLRSFPNTEVSRATFGPDAASSFEQARKELTAAGRGKLIVKSTDNAVIYINEKIEASGEVKKDNLLPGEYRVFAKFGKQLSRRHVVVVKPNETTQLPIDDGFDVAVQTSPTWTGLAFTSSADRYKTEVSYAARFGTAVDAEAVAVVGIDEVRGKRSIVGLLVDQRGSTMIRGATIALDPDPSTEQIKALAEFLAGENLDPNGIEVLPLRGVPKPDGPNPPDDTDMPGRKSGLWGGWKFVTGGAALVALGVGGYTLSLDGTCRDELASPPCQDLYNTAVPAYLTIGGGVVLGAVTVYLFMRKDSAPSKTAYIVPTSGGALAGFTGRF